jgi:hypothetical protein
VSNEFLPRRYSEKEAGAILRKAAEMQRAEPSAADPSGFSLTELEEVAREAGIDPAVVRSAAAELDVPASESFSAALVGGPLTVRVETELPGEYPAERFDALVPAIQNSSPWQGHAGVVGKSLTWSARADSNTSSLQVLVVANEGKTLIRVEERLGGFAGALFGGVIGGVGAGAGIGIGAGVGAAIGSTLMAVGFPVLMIGGSYYLSRAIYSAYVKKERGKLTSLLDQLSAHASSVIAEQSADAAIAASTDAGILPRNAE